MARELPTQPPIIISSLVLERIFGGTEPDINIRLTNNIESNEKHGVVSKVKNLHTGEEMFIWHYDGEEKLTVESVAEPIE